MQCKCGEETKFSSHFVKTITKAREWSDKVTEDDLPILVEQDKCPACGRFRRKIFASEEFIAGQG